MTNSPRQDAAGISEQDALWLMVLAFGAGVGVGAAIKELIRG
jgi:hypothetical protein